MSNSDPYQPHHHPRATILTQDEALGTVHGDVLVENGTITSVGPDLPADGASELPGHGKVVLPGAGPSPPLFVSSQVKDKLWHIPFNRVQALPEKLIAGREDVYFGNEFAIQGGDAAGRRHRRLRPGPVRPGSTARQPRVLPGVR